MKFGDKVLVKSRFWKNNFVGEISWYPVSLNECYTVKQQKTYEEKETKNGIKKYYWVVFIEEQIDSDEDGPYCQAEISEDDLVFLK